MKFRALTAACLAAALAGCRQSEPPPYVDYKPSGDPKVSSRGDAYDRLAKEITPRAEKYLNKVTFSADVRKHLSETLAPQLSALLRAQQVNQGTINFEPTAPFAPRPNRAEWRLLSRTLVWKIEALGKEMRFDEAITWALCGTRFGFDMTAGNVADATLGLTIIDDVRRVMLPLMLRLESKQLIRLGAGLRIILESRPSFDEMMENETQNMMAAVEFVQTAYRTGDYKVAEDKLGADVGPAIVYLQEMKSADAAKRPDYFRSFAAEAETMSGHYKAIANMPAVERKSAAKPALAEERPWRRFSKQFFQSAAPVIEMRDKTIARTKLLSMHANILATIRITKKAPASLSTMPDSVRLDPFTGQSFVYSANGFIYRLYSVGIDGQDDGGDTDESYMAPDLRIETHEF